jgi:hypothetical protein
MKLKMSAYSMEPPPVARRIPAAQRRGPSSQAGEVLPSETKKPVGIDIGTGIGFGFGCGFGAKLP